MVFRVDADGRVDQMKELGNISVCCALEEQKSRRSLESRRSISLRRRVVEQWNALDKPDMIIIFLQIKM